MKTLILIRGLPGSGKSTFAKKLIRKYKQFYSESDISNFEADDCFIHNGKYEWNKNELQLAHKQCFENTKSALEYETPIVIVSNTFLSKFEIDPYINLASKTNSGILIYRMRSQYENVHSVPAISIANMKKRFVDVESEILID